MVGNGANMIAAQEILKRRKCANRQIIMITDGKPSAIHEEGGLYKNPFGLDRKVVGRIQHDRQIADFLNRIYQKSRFLIAFPGQRSGIYIDHLGPGFLAGQHQLLNRFGVQICNGRLNRWLRNLKIIGNQDHS